MDYEISLPSDEDGYTTLQCPYCREKFKIKNDEFEEQDVDDDILDLLWDI